MQNKIKRGLALLTVIIILLLYLITFILSFFQSEQAKELLKNTNKKIYEIAQETGYISATSFQIAFKKQEGITPIEFRNQ